MMTAAELRVEARRLRTFALTVIDPAALAEIRTMIAELERRARALGNGDGGGDDGESDWNAARDGQLGRHRSSVVASVSGATMRSRGQFAMRWRF
jgi:hypothetical protein